MKKKKAAAIINIVIILIVAYAVFFVGKITATLGDDSIKLKCTLIGSTTIPYDKINSVEFTEQFDIGSRTFGMGSFKINAGKFKNNELGSYKLYSYSRVDAFIKIYHEDGVLVFNQSDEEATKNMYEQLLSKITK